MEINITQFVTNEDAHDFSASRAERGDNAGPETWANAVRQGTDSPLLTTPEQLAALREYVEGFGAWDEEVIATWTDAECNAMFIQLVSGDLRESGLADSFLDEFDWDEYESRAAAGTISGNIYRGSDEQVYYYLGV